MKRLLVFCVFFLLLGSTSPGETAETYKAPQYHYLENDPVFYVMDVAAQNISINIPMLSEMYQKIDPCTGGTWEMHFADKMQSQPVAVLQLMARNPVLVERMCPRDVMEDTLTDEEYRIWKERTVASLEAFTMADAQEEAVRRECVQLIRESLAKENRTVSKTQ